MRAIDKEAEPRELKEYRCQPAAVYDGPLFTPVKQAIREQLLREQGWLCAYCMKRIADPKAINEGRFDETTAMKVEHWHCQEKHPGEQLNYQNMLGVCLGNEGQPLEKQTCDSRKGNQELKYNPVTAAHRIESHIRFLGNGKIQSEDAEFDCQLNEVLKLNGPRLEENRKAVWNAVHNTLDQRPGRRTVADLEKLLAQWGKPDADGRLREYCAVAVYYLRKRLKACHTINR